MENRTFVRRLFEMKDMKAMIIALAWLLPASIVLGGLLWTSTITSQSIKTFNLESILYVITLFVVTATMWLLVPGLLFILCLVMDGIRAVRNKIDTLRKSNETTT